VTSGEAVVSRPNRL